MSTLIFLLNFVYASLSVTLGLRQHVRRCLRCCSCMEELVVECVGGETIELGEEGNVDGVGDDTGQGTHETLHLPNWCEEDEN